MTPRRPRNPISEALDPVSVRVHLSDRTRNAFADLEAAVHFSDCFDVGIRMLVKDFATGTDASVEDVIVSLPSIAEETFAHIAAVGDERARAAWRALCEALPEQGFTLTRERVRAGHSRSS